MASLYKKPVVLTDPKTGQRIKAKSKKWWGRFKDENGLERRVPLATDKTAAQAMLNEMVKKVERRAAGLIDPTEEQRKRPLAEHVGDFKRHLQNKGVSPKQVYTVTTQLQRMIDACKWRLLGDISATKALDFLGDLSDSGRSAQTYNHYLRAAKQFTRWLIRERRLLIDPLAHLSKINVSTDRRHDRRVLSPEEFTLLVEAARNGKPVESISGPDRAMMYVLAGWTGFRKGEIGSLTRRSFRLDVEPATATVEACYSKRRRRDTQILHSELVRMLVGWISTKPDLGDEDLLFPVSGKVPRGKERKTHKMMRVDLDAARQQWIEEADSDEERRGREESDFLAYCDHDGRFADFHSNRHMFITSLERAGLSPKMAQTLARHSDVRLTLGLYTHLGTSDQAAAIAALPGPPGLDTKQEAGEVPTRVPRGAEIGAKRPASGASDSAPVRTELGQTGNESGDSRVAATPDVPRRVRTTLRQSALSCTRRK